MQSDPDLSIIVLTWRDEEFLDACLASLRPSAGDLDLQVIVVENGEHFAPCLAGDEKLSFEVIQNDVNRGVAGGRNQGLGAARGRYLMFLDVDTRVTGDALAALVRFMDAHPEVGLAAPRLVDADGNLQYSCRRLPTVWSKVLRRVPLTWASQMLADELMTEWDHRSVREVDYVIGACQIVRRAAFEQVGYLEARIFYGPEDIDYCIRMWQKGWRVAYMPQATVVHYERRLTRRRLFSRLSVSHALGIIFFFSKYLHLLRLPKWPLRSQLRWTLVLGDALLVNLAGLLSLWLGVQRSRWWLAADWGDSFLAWFLFLTLIWFVLAEVNDLYDLRVAGMGQRALAAMLRVVVETLLVYLVLYFLAAPQTLPRHIIIFFALIATSIVSLWRLAFAVALHALPFQRRVLLVGDGGNSRVLLQAIREYAPAYYHLLRLANGRGETHRPGEGVATIVGATTDLPAIVTREHIDEIFLSQTDGLGDKLLEALVVCREQGVQVSSTHAVYEQLTGRVAIEHVGPEWLETLPWQEDPDGGLAGALKRVLDVIVALCGFLIMLLCWLLLLLAVRLDSPGPVLHRQTRVGKNGRPFNLYKFRTMVLDAEQPGAPTWAAPDDPRVTRVGRFLRRLRLDELPQFVNVLKGEMSIVGPRPERPEIVARLQKEIPLYRIRHAVRPGLTGWAAIHFGYGRSLEDARVKLEYDLFYIKHHSLYLDLLIMAKTLGSIITPPRR